MLSQLARLFRREPTAKEKRLAFLARYKRVCPSCCEKNGAGYSRLAGQSQSSPGEYQCEVCGESFAACEM